MFITAKCAECGKINNSPRADVCSQSCRMRRNRRLKRQHAEDARATVQTLLDLVPTGGIEARLLRSVDRALVELSATK